MRFSVFVYEHIIQKVMCLYLFDLRRADGAHRKCHITVFKLPNASSVSHWLWHRRLCSGDMTCLVGMRYFAKLPVCSNSSVVVRVAAQLSAGRPN